MPRHDKDLKTEHFKHSVWLPPVGETHGRELPFVGLLAVLLVVLRFPIGTRLSQDQAPRNQFCGMPPEETEPGTCTLELGLSIAALAMFCVLGSCFIFIGQHLYTAQLCTVYHRTAQLCVEILVF